MKAPYIAPAAAVLAALMLAQPAGAANFSNPTSSDDTIVGKAFILGGDASGSLGYYPSDAPYDFIGTNARVSGGPRVDQQKVIGFTLPLLDVATITHADLTIEKQQAANAPFNLDLYALNTTNPDTSGTTLFYEGANDPSQSKLADDVLSGDFSLPDLAFIDVTSLIQNLYTGITPNQSEVFFRLNPNMVVPLLAESPLPPSTPQYIALTPNLFLNITTAVPEPMGAATLLAGTTLLMCRRERQQRSEHHHAGG